MSQKNVLSQKKAPKASTNLTATQPISKQPQVLLTNNELDQVVGSGHYWTS